MTLGEIKIEALKLMFLNYSEDIREDQLLKTDTQRLSQLEGDENYSSYLINMPGAINRCFSSLENKGVLPVKTVALKPSDALASGAFMRFDLASIIEDFLDIERVVYENDNGYYAGNYAYKREGNTIVLDVIGEGEQYLVVYKPKIARINSLTPNESELPVPEHIAAFIPYFIKGDLFRDDEPNEASEARNWYEAAMDEILAAQCGNVSQVETIYALTEM